MLRASLRIALPLLVVAAQGISAQTRVTSPEQEFGHPIGADYVLTDYTQFSAYWEKLSRESDRMVLDTIGTTAEGRAQLMAIITSPANHARLDYYRDISRRLALAEGLSEEEARRLAADGRAVVWIDGGLHATEVLGAQQLMETVYQLLSRNDAETTRILDDIIILAVHANPDGMELVSDWYMRESVPTERSTSGIPRLYQKYVGHDNNRDFFASTQPETENMNRVMYTEWYPQIVYNHHQTGPAGTVMFAPPFREPVNHNYDPLIPISIDMVGSAMHDRFLREDKPGVTMRSGASYSTWWNGGLRTMPYFHNMIGLLTETIGNPTPMEIPFIPRRQIPHGDLPAPIEPQTWHFRESVDYSVTANYAVLDLASRRRDVLLYNIWKMGQNSIERGSRDTWTHYPRYVAQAAEQLNGQNGNGDEGPNMNARGGREEFDRLLRDPALRDARGYIIPADQPDFLSAAKFVDALLETGVHVHRATQAFTVNGKSYPAGSFVVKTAQAFRPHVIDMFEPQDHPDDIPYPGGPPTPPYDNAGWTLAYQMGVQFDRILDGFDGPFQKIDGLRAPRPTGGIVGRGNAGWFLSTAVNDAFLAVNRLLAAGHDVYRLSAPVNAGGVSHPEGTFFISQRGSARADVQRIAQETGLTFYATGSRPSGQHTRLSPIKVALWDRYGGSMPSGWTRWIFEQFEVPFEVVYPQTLNEGDLGEYDAIVFVTGAIPAPRNENQGGGGFGARDDDADDVPAEFRHMAGSITAETTIPRLRSYLEQGGTVITIGSSTALAQHLGLPVSSALTEVVDGRERPLPRSKYYIPGSVLQVRVDNTLPVAAGMPQHVDVMYDNSPVFRIDPGAQNIRRIAWFDSPNPLRSGWAWGESVLEGGVAMAEADVGRGSLFLFGPEVLFRAQPHGTFRFVFNGLYANAGEESRIR